jgi:hypothetical protein
MTAFLLHLQAVAELLVTPAFAQIISGNANAVATPNGLFAGFGGGGFDGIVLYIRERALLLFIPIGVLIVVRAGIRLIISQDEDKLTKARRTIAATCVGIMMAYISNRLVNAFYTPGGTWTSGAAATGASILSTEIGGIIDWTLVLLAAVAILMIVATGVRAVAGFGKEDGAAELRRTVAGVVTGIGMIMISGAVKLTLGLNPDTSPGGSGMPNASVIILKGVRVVQQILQYMALVAVAIIIYAGLLMILNLGNEEQFNKGKTLIIRAMIGLVIILLSGVMAVFIAQLFDNNPGQVTSILSAVMG